MPSSLKYLYTLLLCVFAMAGCTRVDIAYRNLDVIIPWSMNDYLDLDREQKAWFNERLKEHLSWHCTTQLPGNLKWLDSLQQMVASNQVTDEQLQARTVEAKQAIAQVAAEVTPSAVEFLRGLDDSQVRAMQQAFAEDLAKRRDEFVKPPLAEQIQDRAKRMIKRLTPWFGDLSASQRQRVQAWSQQLGEQNREWIDNREHWQGLFIDALNHRQDAGFDQRIATLLQQRESLWTPQYALAYAHTEQAARTLLVGLMADSTPTQRQRVQERLADLHKDFNQLKCLKAASQ
ncbi:DUF6279 family lipoprotein [Pseudomonas abieticivorans]|uniref:DUF6279 family lipoprotein n=1 Tax=Pseudomonas abieticivorans TaxID=2931382 RepID=UPI0020BE18FA|nr:DUF6279 family lipoprotein [Pseudomonas sp. PIA16]